MVSIIGEIGSLGSKVISSTFNGASSGQKAAPEAFGLFAGLTAGIIGYCYSSKYLSDKMGPVGSFITSVALGAVAMQLGGYFFSSKLAGSAMDVVGKAGSEVNRALSNVSDIGGKAVDGLGYVADKIMNATNMDTDKIAGVAGSTTVAIPQTIANATEVVKDVLDGDFEKAFAGLKGVFLPYNEFTQLRDVFSQSASGADAGVPGASVPAPDSKKPAQRPTVSLPGAMLSP